jgi:hypothetical protein
MAPLLWTAAAVLAGAVVGVGTSVVVAAVAELRAMWRRRRRYAGRHRPEAAPGTLAQRFADTGVPAGLYWPPMALGQVT